MKKRIALLCTAALVFSLSACGQTEQTQNESEAEVQTESQNESQTDTPSEAPAEAADGELAMSDMVIRITSQEYTATFQMYDTAAAEELYKQLPLELELSNFADAQWMFYPPEELNVTDEEIYRDGKKGELSYYEPWGDVFMLYEDFQSGDNMHRLGVCLSGIDEIEHMSGNVSIEKEEETEPAENTSEGIQQEEDSMQIQVESDGNTIVFELNDSQAARELYEQLPLSIEVEDYSTNEKIFYPPEELDVSDAPLAEAGAGTLAYYAPWGDVVMFYEDFGGAGGLYELGEAVSGAEYISELSGSIQVEQLEE